MIKDNLRNVDRVPLEFLVRYQDDGQMVDEFCSNLSSGGLFIESISTKIIGTVIDINLTLPHNHQGFSLKGEVVWLRAAQTSEGPPGMGIKFVEISNKQQEDIASALVYYNKILEHRV